MFRLIVSTIIVMLFSVALVALVELLGGEAADRGMHATRVFNKQSSVRWDCRASAEQMLQCGDIAAGAAIAAGEQRVAA